MVEVLSFSGGWQSSVLAWMVIRGEIKVRRDLFALVSADTGDEREKTYDNLKVIQDAAREAGLTCLNAAAKQNIVEDWQEGGTEGRIEQIPYWTKKPDGSIGQLNHSCTRHYKVRPMQRAITAWLQDALCISKGKAQRVHVTSWIGFASDEQNRAKKFKTDAARWHGRFPLIELGMTKEGCWNYIWDNKLPEPIPSVCAGCFANGLRTLKWMHDNDRPAWERALARDRWVRHGLKQFGVIHDVYVSSTCIPLEELKEMDFKLPVLKETAKHECTQGACFI